MFITLHNGISIDSYSNKYVKIEQLYIKWNEKLDLSVNNIKIRTKSSSKSKLDIHKLTNTISKSALFIRIFEHLNLKTIAIDDIKASFYYEENEGGVVQASSKDFNLHSILSPAHEKLYIAIDKLNLIKQKTDIKGTILLHNNTIQTTLNIDINNDISLQLDAISNKKSLHYKVTSLKNIKSINYLVDTLNIPNAIRYWIIDAIDMSYLDIKEARGWLEYDHIDDAIKNIYVKANVNDLNYKYNKALDAVHTKYTELIFKDGILYIYPKVAYSYGQYLADSWVKIDFSKSPIVLTINLLFDGKLNQDVLKILKTYKINLPFLQKDGNVDVNLKIDVDLQNIKVDAKGEFYTKEANFDYLGLNIDIFNARIYLDNYDVKINNMLAHYKDIAVTDVDVIFDAKTKIGQIDFKAKSIQFNDIDLKMKKAPLMITYHIIPNNNYIDVKNSLWDFLGYELAVNALKIPLDTNNLILKVPTTKVYIKDMATLYTSGNVKLPSLESNFDIDVVAFDYLGFQLTDKISKLKFLYKDSVNIISDNPINLLKNENNLTLEKSYVNIKNSILKIKTHLNANNIVQTDLALNYPLKNKQGILEVKNLNILLQNNLKLLELNNPAIFSIENRENIFKLSNHELSTYFQATDDLFTLKIKNMAPLLKYSPLLKNRRLENSNLFLSKNYQSDILHFSTSLLSPHKPLVINNIPTQQYNATGTINIKKKNALIHVNDKVDISVDKNITIDMKDVGIDIFETLDALENNITTTTSSTLPTLYLHAKDSYIYISKHRKIISDKIDLKYKNNKIGSILTYKDAKAFFNLNGDKFTLYGENFNDTFMSNLFSLSKFKGGRLDFSMQGHLKEYVGTLNLTNTTILEYKLLNNILAFVNTIPSLITFSLPGYDSNGLLVDNAYMNFNTKNDIYTISDIYLDSKEIDILGHGDASFKNNAIDLELNLKTDLASALSQIPLVGYILFDKDSISTTLKVDGKLDDPKVKSLLAKDIIVAPLNILQRTIMLPFNLFSDDE